MANFTKFTQERQKEFLDRIAAGWSITDGAEHAGVTPRTIYVHKTKDAAFAEAMGDALESGSDVLEDEARRRAVDGVTKPVYYQGVECGAVQEYSDSLLQFLLKARRPEKYRERADLRHSGPTGGSLTVKHEFDYDEYQRLFVGLAASGSAELDTAAGHGPGEPLDPSHADAAAGALPR
jgi:hypothetical protein